MEVEKKMMVVVAENLIKDPPSPAVLHSCCQNKNNGLSELDFSQRNSSVAKPECIILPTTVRLKRKNIVVKVFFK